jgi:hypothetical protein
MARRPSLALLIIIAGAFFLIGLYTAFLQVPQGTPAPTGTPSDPAEAGPTTTAQSEQTALIVGVNDLTATSPELRSLWFVSFRPPAMDVFLLGIPLDTVVQGDPGLPISAHFSLNEQRELSETFVDALFRTVPLTYQTTVVLDEQAFAGLVDFVGGVPINDATFSGQEVLGILSLTDGDPAGNLALQRRLLAALAERAGLLGRAPEVTSLVELMPTHLRPSITLNEMVGLVAPLLPLQATTTHIELY